MKYPRYIFERLTGETLKSFLAPLALSCTIVRFTQNVTVTQLTAKSAATSWDATVPSINLSVIVNPSGNADVKESLYTFAKNVAHQDIFRDYEVVKGGMDDVFLAVTGKVLGGEN